MRHRSLSLLVLALGACQPGLTIETSQQSVINGSADALAALPAAEAVARLWVGSYDANAETFSREARCTAVAIGKYTLLTSAHCVTGKASHLLALFAAKEGQDIDGDGKPDRTILADSSAITRHPRWRKDSLDYDIAVVRLPEPASVTPAFVATRVPARDTKVVIVGAGATGTANGDWTGQGPVRAARNRLYHLTSHTATLLGYHHEDDGAAGLLREGNFAPGDSGGAIFNERLFPQLIGLNRNISVWATQDNQHYYGHGSALLLPPFVDWLKKVSCDDVRTVASEASMASPECQPDCSGLACWNSKNDAPPISAGDAPRNAVGRLLGGDGQAMIKLTFNVPDRRKYDLFVTYGGYVIAAERGYVSPDGHSIAFDMAVPADYLASGNPAKLKAPIYLILLDQHGNDKVVSVSDSADGKGEGSAGEAGPVEEVTTSGCRIGAGSLPPLAPPLALLLFGCCLRRRNTRRGQG